MGVWVPSRDLLVPRFVCAALREFQDSHRGVRHWFEGKRSAKHYLRVWRGTLGYRIYNDNDEVVVQLSEILIANGDAARDGQQPTHYTAQLHFLSEESHHTQKAAYALASLPENTELFVRKPTIVCTGSDIADLLTDMHLGFSRVMRGNRRGTIDIRANGYAPRGSQNRHGRPYAVRTGMQIARA